MDLLIVEVKKKKTEEEQQQQQKTPNNNKGYFNDIRSSGNQIHFKKGKNSSTK